MDCLDLQYLHTALRKVNLDTGGEEDIPTENARELLLVLLKSEPISRFIMLKHNVNIMEHLSDINSVETTLQQIILVLNE